MKSEVGGIAGLRSLEKIVDGTAKEMIVIIEEESVNGVGRTLTDEERRYGEENMNSYYLYITK